MIDQQIENANNQKSAYIGIKINSLTDKKLIDKLIEASKAGVKIDLIVRGICCLRPKVKGYTDNITVVSIVGRFLEHSRIYIFGMEDEQKVYIASADFMTRNTVRRVEVATPIYNEDIKKRITDMFDIMLSDNEKGKEQDCTGEYKDRPATEEPINSQELFYKEAYDASGESR